MLRGILGDGGRDEVYNRQARPHEARPRVADRRWRPHQRLLLTRTDRTIRISCERADGVRSFDKDEWKHNRIAIIKQNRSWLQNPRISYDARSSRSLENFPG